MLINNLEKFKEIIPTAASVDDYADLKPYVESAKIWLITHVLGKSLYDRIKSGDSSGGADAPLIALCNNVICNHAYWDAIPFLDVQHTNAGFGVVQNNNLAPASAGRVKSLRDQCLVRRDNEVENLIDYLEDNAGYHDDWKSSPAYSILSDCLIQTARELAIYAEWEGNRKEFLKLRPRLIQITMNNLEPLFSKDYIEELIEKQRDGDLTGDDARVAILLKQSLGSMITDNKVAAEKVAFDALRYIDENLDSFETYAESKEHKARIAANYQNTADDPIFSSLF